MKAIPTLFLSALAALILVSCSNPDRILPKADGRWQNSRIEVQTYLDGVLLSDTAFTNEGYTNFNSDGTGFTEDNSGNNTGNFSWSVSDDVLTISDDSSTTTATILDISNKTFSTNSVEEGDFLGSTLRVESTSELNRADN